MARRSTLTIECRRLEAERDELLAALKRAEEAIHSEYCGYTCHPECVAVTAVIAKAERVSK